jgi:hypothetical protein
MTGRKAERRKSVTFGTGNVFADLGFPRADERQAKLRLAFTLNQVIEERKLRQADAAKLLGVTQPKGLCASPLQARWLFCREVDELADRTRPGCRDRDSTQAPLTEGWADQCRRGIIPNCNGAETQRRSSTAQNI